MVNNLVWIRKLFIAHLSATWSNASVVHHVTNYTPCHFGFSTKDNIIRVLNAVKEAWLSYSNNNRGGPHPLVEAYDRPQTAAHSTATAQAAAQ